MNKYHEVNIQNLVKDCDSTHPVCNLKNDATIRNILTSDKREGRIEILCQDNPTQCAFKNYNTGFEPYSTICIHEDMLYNNTEIQANNNRLSEYSTRDFPSLSLCATTSKP
jgi:hypothetical protein